MEFCEKHKISMDWLLCGYMQVLRRMTQEARTIPPEITETQCKQVTQLLLAISPRMPAVALGCMRELMTRGYIQWPRLKSTRYETPAPIGRGAQPATAGDSPSPVGRIGQGKLGLEKIRRPARNVVPGPAPEG